MDITVKRNHKGYLIEIIVEDSLITTGKIYKSSEFIDSYDITDRNGHEFPYNKLNRDKVLARFKKEVDRIISENRSRTADEAVAAKQ